jgi:hypothetical protein
MAGGSIEVFDVMGAKVISVPQISSATFDLDVTGLRRGIYFLVFTDLHGKEVPVKFMKQ